MLVSSVVAALVPIGRSLPPPPSFRFYGGTEAQDPLVYGLVPDLEKVFDSGSVNSAMW
jgi:hypothetical protein